MRVSKLTMNELCILCFLYILDHLTPIVATWIES